MLDFETPTYVTAKEAQSMQSQVLADAFYLCHGTLVHMVTIVNMFHTSQVTCVMDA